MAKFQPGNPGRPKGSRNRLHKDVLDAYAEDFATQGKDLCFLIFIVMFHIINCHNDLASVFALLVQEALDHC